MRSYYDENQINEQESRNYFNTICTQLKWKFRSYDQDNDIDGEIEIFSPKRINEKIVYETEASFIKIQLKSTNNIKGTDTHISYDCPIKLLHFADVCEIPIILVLYDVNNQMAYWLWLQEYIYNILDKNNTEWRKNQSSVAIKLSKEEIVGNNEKFKSETEEIAYNGINEIQQLRKIDTIDYYYTELSQKDCSFSIYRRIQVEILLEKSFSQSKNAMRILIQKMNEKYKKSDYFRNEQVRNMYKEVDVLWLHFFNDMRQKKNGIAFCFTEWKNPNNEIDADTIIADEIIDDIKIQWDTTDSVLQNLYVNQRMTKGEYIELCSKVYNKMISVSTIFNTLANDFHSRKIQEMEIIEEILKYFHIVDELYDEYTLKQQYPPFECSDLNQKMIELLTSLHNIMIILKDDNRDISNKMWGINFYLKDYNEKLPEFNYELKKIH